MSRYSQGECSNSNDSIFFHFEFKLFEKENWSALYDVRTILLSIQSLLGEPNLLSPLDLHAAKLWGKQDYRKLVLEKVKLQINSA